MDLSFDATLETLRRAAVRVPRAPEDDLTLAGSDATDLLHRIGASEVRDLVEGDERQLVLTDDKGAIVDLPLARRRATGWSLSCGRGRGPALRAWIERWVITEDVRVEVADGPTSVEAHGPATGVSAPPWYALLRVDDPRAREFPAGDPDAVRWFHLERGELLAGPALATGPNPLELGLGALVSFTKGCFIGQEVLARLHHYEKVRRRLGVWRGAAPVEAGARLRLGGRQCGRVLESMHRGGRTLALCLVELGVDAGAQLEAENAGAGGITFPPAP